MIGPDDPRVRLAEDRTVLAAERTFAAWLRTGLAFLGVGLAAQRYLRDVLPSLPLEVLGSVLIACAVLCFFAAGWRDWRVRQRLPEAEVHFLPLGLTVGIAALLALVSIAAGSAIWVH